MTPLLFPGYNYLFKTTKVLNCVFSRNFFSKPYIIREEFWVYNNIKYGNKLLKMYCCKKIWTLVSCVLFSTTLVRMLILWREGLRYKTFVTEESYTSTKLNPIRIQFLDIKTVQGLSPFGWVVVEKGGLKSGKFLVRDLAKLL